MEVFTVFFEDSHICYYVVYSSTNALSIEPEIHQLKSIQCLFRGSFTSDHVEKYWRSGELTLKATKEPLQLTLRHQTLMIRLMWKLLSCASLFQFMTETVSR